MSFKLKSNLRARTIHALSWLNNEVRECENCETIMYQIENRLFRMIPTLVHNLKEPTQRLAIVRNPIV
jgi:hypothetical protein